MISWHDLYNVLAAMVPLYVAMILAYGSVRWWKIFTPDQCSGINRFVAVFAVPLLSFHFISTNNPYEFNLRFIAADTLQKLIMLAALTVWSNLPFRRKNSKSPSLGWIITLFSLSTLPNTLVMGIPLLIAMYGPYSGSLMVQVVVLQCIIWYTLLLFLFEYRGAKILISEQFPETGASIVSFKVDSDVVSLDGGEFLETDAEVGDDGKIHVRVRKSNVSRRSVSGGTGIGGMGMMTPRPSNLTGAEIYSLSSSRNPTPRGSNFNNSDFYSMMGYGVGGGFGNSNMNVRNSNFGAADLYSLQSSRGPTPRPSNYEETQQQQQGGGSGWGSNSNNNPYPSPNPEFVGLGGVEAGKNITGGRRRSSSGSVTREGESAGGERKMNHHHDAKELHMFVWSSSASPVSEVGGLHVFGGTHNHPQNHVQQDYLNSNSMMISGGRRSGSGADDGAKEIRMLVSSDAPQNRETTKLGNHNQGGGEVYGGDQFSFGGGKVGGSLEYENEKEKAVADDDDDGLHIGLSKLGSSSTVELHPDIGVGGEGGATEESSGPKQMPPASVMTRLILIMVWRKLIRNPNTYSSLIGVIWSLIAFRWNVEMPKIIKGSISILSDAGLGMAMFSLGLFMALQPKIIACGNSVAAYSMLVRFVTGPAVMAIASIIIGLRGDLLRIAIIQAALPQGIVPFVFSKEYNNHPAILSTAVIFGMLIALPIDLLYYILLRL